MQQCQIAVLKLKVNCNWNVIVYYEIHKKIINCLDNGLKNSKSFDIFGMKSWKTGAVPLWILHNEFVNFY